MKNIKSIFCEIFHNLQFRNDKFNTLRLYKLSDKFVSSLTELTAGYLHPGQYDQFISIIEDEIKNHFFTYSSESNLYRIIHSMYDKTAFINDAILYPHYIEILVIISVNSNYLADILVRNPEYFYWIVNPSNLNSQPDEFTFEEIVKSTISSYKNFETKISALRRLKRKEMLRIALNDLTGNRNLEQTTSSLSLIARVLSRVLFDLCYKEVMLKYKIEYETSSYCLVSLGKLGGNELNYSSDIDLILFFDKNTKVNNREYFEMLSEAAKLFIDRASAMTDSGYLFRIDFRLRPDGKNSLLCRTIQDYLSYYESKGEDWERQMLIKASYCGGDINLYDRFIKYLTPFIYPASFSNSPFEQIIKLKSNVERNINEDNIKLFAGGIRDIEFSVQALQLINGGKYKEIRTGNTLHAIVSLNHFGFLDIKESSVFTDAYLLYRKIEHFLQLMNDKQTHTIPDEGEELEQLSFNLGFNTSKIFKSQINEVRNNVRRIYSTIFGMETKNDICSEVKFESKKKAAGDILFLRTGEGILGNKTFDKSTTDNFSLIEKEFYLYLKKSADPDKTLRNFVRIIRNVSFPGQWYASFNDNKFFNKFLDLCTYSQKSIDLFAEDPDLKEFFITKKAFEKLNSAKIKSYSLRQILFVLSTQYVLNMINDVQVSSALSNFLINKIIDLAKEANINVPYAIAGAGSLGNSEMNFSSDIDLLFICKDEKDLPKLQKVFQDLLNKIRQELKPFDADCRLRPEGKSSYLVWSIESQMKYIQTRARIWELQSFSKLRFIYGDKNLVRMINDSIVTRLKTESKVIIRKELLEMRKKLYPQSAFQNEMLNIKKDRGGFLDIEFMVQYILLLNPNLFKKAQAKKLTKILLLLERELNDHEFYGISENYHLMKRLLLANQCAFNSSGYKILLGKTELNILEHFTEPEENIKEKLSVLFRFNNFMFNKYTGV